MAKTVILNTLRKCGRMGLPLVLTGFLSAIIILCLSPSALLDTRLSLLDVRSTVRYVPREELSEHSIVVHSPASESVLRHLIVRRPRGRARFVGLMLHGTHPSQGDIGHLTAPRFFERALVNRTRSWREQGFALIYLASRLEGPGSTRFCWGAGSGHGLCTASYKDKQDETFLVAVLDVLAHLHLDGLPVYLMGFSGGGRMVWRAACNSSLAQRISGIFVASGLLAAELRAEPPLCQLATMPPMVIMHGTGDKIVPIRLAEGVRSYPALRGLVCKLLYCSFRCCDG